MAHDHHHHIDPADRSQESQRVTLIGAVVNGVLSLAKILIGWLSNSSALVADGIHSLSDLISDALVWFAARYGSEDADEEHPYGHARIETLATLFLGALLIGVALGLVIDALRRLTDSTELGVHAALAFGVAIVSILSKEALYHYTVRVARRVKSKMLEANAWHHRTDSLSSIVVLVGLLGVANGLPFLDAVAALVVALMVAHVGWELASDAGRELIDTALDETEVTQIRQQILDVEGVVDLHMLRTRRMGHGGMADVHIQVPGHVSVSEGHQIAENVRRVLIEGGSNLHDITVHTDAEDDDEAPDCASLPTRSGVEHALADCWADDPAQGAVLGLRLHYLSGKVQASVVLDLGQFDDLADARAAAQRLAELAQPLDYLSRTRFDFRYADAP